MSDLKTFRDFDWQKTSRSYVYLGAAGFEQRAFRGPQLVSESLPLKAAIVLEFRKSISARNERNLRRIVSCLTKRVPTSVHQIGAMDEVGMKIAELVSGPETTILVDVTAMPHSAILRSLRFVADKGATPLVIYTEAEEYYPRFGDAHRYLRFADDERAFLAASRYEHKEIMYAGLTSIGIVKGFEGRILPTAPSTIILFPTFKRLRTAAILSDLEVNKKVFIVGSPVRADLEWRQRALRIINYDLIDEDTDVIVAVETLSPVACYNKLDELIQEGVACPRGNIIICPHGSKMQTVGVWRFCMDNPDVRVVLAHPKEFFDKKYSIGYRDTFVFDPGSAWR
jgi:hypothetical protein